MSFHVPNQYRVTRGLMGSDDSYGNQGAFTIPAKAKLKRALTVIARDGVGWEHVSVSLPDRTPTWEEMCYIKSLFWDDEDCVVQYHPPKSTYVNNHRYCLHMWRPLHMNLPTPPTWMVGIKSVSLTGGIE